MVMLFCTPSPAAPGDNCPPPSYASKFRSAGSVTEWITQLELLERNTSESHLFSNAWLTGTLRYGPLTLYLWGLWVALRSMACCIMVHWSVASEHRRRVIGWSLFARLANHTKNARTARPVSATMHHCDFAPSPPPPWRGSLFHVIIMRVT